MSRLFYALFAIFIFTTSQVAGQPRPLDNPIPFSQESQEFIKELRNLPNMPEFQVLKVTENNDILIFIVLCTPFEIKKLREVLLSSVKNELLQTFSYWKNEYKSPMIWEVDDNVFLPSTGGEVSYRALLYNSGEQASSINFKTIKNGMVARARLLNDHHGGTGDCQAKAQVFIEDKALFKGFVPNQDLKIARTKEIFRGIETYVNQHFEQQLGKKVIWDYNRMKFPLSFKVDALQGEVLNKLSNHPIPLFVNYFFEKKWDWRAQEALNIEISIDHETNGATLRIVITGKYGSGIYSLDAKGYRCMEPEYEEQLADYTKNFATYIKKHLTQ